MPLYTPVMAQLKTKFAFYNVSLRSIWDGFEDFSTSSGAFSLDGEVPPEIPQASMRSLVRVLSREYYDVTEGRENFVPYERTLFDYLDYPYYTREEFEGSVSQPRLDKPVSVLPLIAMGYIYQEWFLNENIQPVLKLRELRKLRGDISTWSDFQRQTFSEYVNYGFLFRVNWNKDYLTASQPYSQKGQDVVIPLNVTLPDDFSLDVTNPPSDNTGKWSVFVTESGELVRAVSQIDNVGNVRWTRTDNGATVPANAVVQFAGTYDNNGNLMTANGPSSLGPRFLLASSTPFLGQEVALKPASSQQVRFNLRGPNGQPVDFASSLTVNELRQSSAIQRLLESKAVGGSRYVEYALHQFGVRISDKTLQRPEFLGGSSIPIQIGEVVQQSASEEDSKLGRFGGTGYTRGGAAAVKCYCEEPSYLIGLMWTKPPTSYFWGVPRHLFMLDPLDLMNPHFANLGAQEVYDFEAMRDPDDPDRVFGYLQRYDDLRTKLDRVHGDMRIDLTDWHMARNNVKVTLSPEFIEARPTTRIFNMTATQEASEEDHLVHQVVVHIQAKRSIPAVAAPMIK